jgi:uncharacterized protein YfaP (DUF2135 family)
MNGDCGLVDMLLSDPLFVLMPQKEYVDGKTALQLAYDNGRDSVVEVFERHSKRRADVEFYEEDFNATKAALM